MMTAFAGTLGLAFRGRPATYHRDAGCVALINVAQVEDLLKERTELRRARDFSSADRVLESLRELGVAVDDDAKTWFVGGRSEWQRPDGNRREQAARHSREKDTRRKTPKKKPAKAKVDRDAPYSRSASCAATLTDTQAAEIAATVAERLAAKRSKRYADADALLAELGRRRVCVADETREWRADGGTFAAEYAQRYGGAGGRGEATPAATLTAVSALLQARSLCLSLANSPSFPDPTPHPGPSSKPDRFPNADPNVKPYPSPSPERPDPNPDLNPDLNPNPNPSRNSQPQPGARPRQGWARLPQGRRSPQRDAQSRRARRRPAARVAPCHDRRAGAGSGAGPSRCRPGVRRAGWVRLGRWGGPRLRAG